MVNQNTALELRNITNGSDERWDHQRDDDALQHVEEEGADELHVHGLPLAPDVLGVLETQSKPDA